MKEVLFGNWMPSRGERFKVALFLVGNGIDPKVVFSTMKGRFRKESSKRKMSLFLSDLEVGKYYEKYSYFDVREGMVLLLNGTIPKVEGERVSYTQRRGIMKREWEKRAWAGAVLGGKEVVTLEDQEDFLRTLCKPTLCNQGSV